jgi:hypothetical protein
VLVDVAEQFQVTLQTVTNRVGFLLQMMAWQDKNLMKWLNDSEEMWETAKGLATRLREALHETA